MKPFLQVEKFLLKYCSSRQPLLLALSGGADSLFLFYSLLFFREKYDHPFHIAHVDHRWREESQAEAEILRELALQHQVPFHLKVLDPSQMTKNLEAACRKERYAFFYELIQTFSLQGVLTGHHLDDQAETVFKRLFEGSHWSCWKGLKDETWIGGVRVLRPLLKMKKKDIQAFLFKKNMTPFEDPSNQEVKYLRARMRKTLFPSINREFGKDVQKNLVLISEEMGEIADYFDQRLRPLLKTIVRSSSDLCLDLKSQMPESLIEVKYLLRLFCREEGIFLSREIIENGAIALQKGKPNQLFIMGNHQIKIDRQRIFVQKLSKIE